MTVSVDNSHSHVVEVTHEGYGPMTCILNSTMHTPTVIFDIITGFVWLLVDAITGGWKRLEKKICTVTLPAM